MPRRSGRPDPTEPAPERRLRPGASPTASSDRGPDRAEERPTTEIAPRRREESDAGLGRPSTEVSPERRDRTEEAEDGTERPGGGPARFGRYEVVGHLATGGMGELLLARQTGPEGFEREVVIKTLLPHLGSDREFITMFLDEARIAARLAHPNIVQILELGEARDRYYIAMELVDGVNLADLLLEADALGRRGMPLEAALPVAIDVCSALHYAHERRDRFGEPLNIVHRDVSPHNVLIAYDGTVKLTDFGIAAADNKVHRTRTGTVKGKMTFMSPEQATARPVDRRSDVFAMGIVLFVMLTGTHPFEPPDAADERDAGSIQTLLRILNAPAPNPRRLRPELPRKLAKVVLKALSKEPSARFATALELRSALEEVAASERLLPSRDAVAGYLAAVMPELVDDWRTRAVTRVPDTGGGVHRALDIVPRRGLATGEVPTAPGPSGPVGRRGGSPRLLAAGAAALLVLGGVAAGLLWSRGAGEGPSRGAVAGVATPLDAAVRSPDGREEETGIAGHRVDFDGGVDAPFVLVEAPEGQDAGAAPDGDAADGDAFEGEDGGGTTMLFDDVPTGTLSLSSNPPALVQLGSVRIGQTPLEMAKVPIGAHRVRLRSGRHGLDYTLPDRVVVQAGEHVDLGHVAVPRGSIRFAVYPWARIRLGGSSLGVTPMAPVAVYPGVHQVTLSCGDGRGANTVRRRVRVPPGGTAVVPHRFEDCR